MDSHSMNNSKSQRKSDLEYLLKLENYFNASRGESIDKLRSFTRFVPAVEFTKLFVKYEIFKSILNVNGSIVECGVHNGGGLFTWAILSSIFEPTNHTRKIFGFDTFQGFPELSAIDKVDQNEHAIKNGLAANSYDELLKGIEIFDEWRPLGHIPKIQLIKGDACHTIEDFLNQNPHVVIAMLYLDFDIYKPTKIALELLVKRMPKGGVIVFDELNNELWPGETVAVNEILGINNIAIKRFPFHPHISYAVL
jgi:hypothetical protein